FIERARYLVAISALQSFFDPRRVDVDAKKNGAVHGCGERLCAAHTTEAAAYNKSSFKRTAKMFPRSGGKCLERPLHNSLTADVYPRSGGHLPIHCESKTLKPVEFGVVVPLADQVRIRDQNARRLFMRPKFSHRLTRLNEQRFVISQLLQRTHDRIE